MKFAKSSQVALTLLAPLVFFLVGCAASPDPKWATLEKRLDRLKEERAVVREKLTKNSTSPDAAALSQDIASLNRQVTLTDNWLRVLTALQRKDSPMTWTSSKFRKAVRLNRHLVL